jgi:hypothetical protein
MPPSVTKGPNFSTVFSCASGLYMADRVNHSVTAIDTHDQPSASICRIESGAAGERRPKVEGEDLAADLGLAGFVGVLSFAVSYAEGDGRGGPGTTGDVAVEEVAHDAEKRFVGEMACWAW